MKTVADYLQGKYRLVEIDHDRTLVAAAKKMNAEEIGALLVTRGGKVVGIITERDMLSKVVAAMRDPANTKVSTVMSAPVISVDLNTPLAICWCATASAQ
jgi:signal-transduction protein with cAMP-binding, CBS, and nucleotidyltransferase domain